MKSFALALLLPALARSVMLEAYKDPKCNERQKIIVGEEEADGNTLNVDIALTDVELHAGGRWYDNVTFPDAETSGEGAGSNVVYWKIPEPDRGCSILVMQQKPTRMSWQYMTKLPGDIIINARREGCFYSSIEEHAGVITSFCCGAGDCKPADLGTNQLLNKREEKTIAITERKALSPAARAAAAVKEGPIISKRDGNRLEQRADMPKCKLIEGSKDNSFLTTGPQRAVSTPQKCEGGECKMDITVETTAGVAISSSSSHEVSTETGIELTVSAGFEFAGASAEVSTSISTSIGESWTEENGKEVSEATTNGVTQTISQQPGTWGFLAFTPIYECFEGSHDCEGAIFRDILTCWPTLSGGTISGRYNMVYM